MSRMIRNKSYSVQAELKRILQTIVYGEKNLVSLSGTIVILLTNLFNKNGCKQEELEELGRTDTVSAALQEYVKRSHQSFK